MIRHALLFAIAIALPNASAFAQNTAPGNYKDWNKVDSVQIVQSFKFADYSKITVLPLDKRDIKMPADTDNTYKPTKQILEESDTHFLEGLRKGVNDFRKDVTVEKSEVEVKDAKVLLVRGKLVALNPGSRAARVFGGFGAGAASAKITIEIVDASTGAVLARMTHERRAGTGNFGGAYEKVMSKALTEVGETFGKGLKGF